LSRSSICCSFKAWISFWWCSPKAISFCKECVDEINGYHTRQDVSLLLRSEYYSSTSASKEIMYANFLIKVYVCKHESHKVYSSIMYTNIIYYGKVPRFKPNGIVTAFHGVAQETYILVPSYVKRSFIVYEEKIPPLVYV
jgi:hypothetical protein